jgi:cytochrome c-type biogenesis protein CcmH/NrfG
MSESKCPSCGARHTADAAFCPECNFPLRESSPTPVAAEASSSGKSDFVLPPRPQRPRAPRPAAMQGVQVQIWVATGILVVAAIVYMAMQGFHRTNASRQVEGANTQQMQEVEFARRQIATDSTNVNARITLANLLYDTANWGEAILQYRAAERLEPRRVETVVDMGVCYYNLGEFAHAESLFTHALSLQPDQPVALFNLGIVAETREEWQLAADWFHRALNANPPEHMRQPLMEHLQTVMAKTGRSAPALPAK